MLEHQKTILKNISNDKHLFRKEIVKSMVWLNSRDLTRLRIWLRENFWDEHSEIISELLYPVYDVA